MFNTYRLGTYRLHTCRLGKHHLALWDTTTLTNETFTLIDTGDTLGAALNIIASVGACLLAVYLGRRLGAAVA